MISQTTLSIPRQGVCNTQCRSSTKYKYLFPDLTYRYHNHPCAWAPGLNIINRYSSCNQGVTFCIEKTDRTVQIQPSWLHGFSGCVLINS